MKCLRIYASADGESHLAEVEIAQPASQVFPGEPPLNVSKQHAATGVQFVTVPAVVKEVGWHNTPARMFGIVLSGMMEFETSDGCIQQVSAGGVVICGRHLRQRSYIAPPRGSNIGVCSSRG